MDKITKLIQSISTYFKSFFVKIKKPTKKEDFVLFYIENCIPFTNIPVVWHSKHSVKLKKINIFHGRTVEGYLYRDSIGYYYFRVTRLGDLVSLKSKTIDRCKEELESIYNEC